MSKKNRNLSEESLGQVSGGARSYNDDGSITLTGRDAERYAKRQARKTLGKNRPIQVDVIASEPVEVAEVASEPSQGDLINNLFE